MTDVRCYLKAFKNDGTVQSLMGNSKRRFLSRIQALPAKEINKYECTINYGGDRSNAFYADTKKELIKKYRIFTANDEIEFINQYWS